MDGRQFAGSMQMLSASTASASEAADAAKSFGEALQHELPETGRARVEIHKGSFAFKQFRTKTKQMLCAVANSLQQALPTGFTLLQAKPSHELLPCGPHGQRFRLMPQEAEAMGLPEDDKCRFFVYDFDSHVPRKDFLDNDDFYHLCFAADEGTEAGKTFYLS